MSCERDTVCWARPCRRSFAGYVSRAKVIDRSLPVEAARAGLNMRELPGTRSPVGGGLEGVIFHISRCDP